MSDPIVSFDDEPLILVDESDDPVGYDSKAACHDGEGLLHRAFSVFLFNGRGDVLLQQRTESKRLWPLFWANSCCSHPRKGEETKEAAVRRVHEELGAEAELEFVYKFQYQAAFGDAGSENELCWVFVGRCDGPIQTNENEVHDSRWVPSEELQAELETHPERYTPWLKLEWRELREHHWSRIESLWNSSVHG
ncbi:MAG: isopentenyl-diphosphate Delta-isomerase [Planctomycetota bacterium]